VLGGLALVVLILAVAGPTFGIRATAQGAQPGRQTGEQQGVASCAGSTCHGRQEANGPVVRQNELLTWQDPSSPSGAHSRAWQVLKQPRSIAIASRLGLGPAEAAPACLACHADTAMPRGPRFQLSDGVGCETCHGAASGWLASHAAVGATHAANVSAGMRPLDQPRARAALCLDCHLGDEGDRFVTHRMMAAGHPRLSFELDLFTTLQQHHDEDADYRARKPVGAAMTTWAVGQSMAVERALRLYARPDRGQDGVFPEFTFFDCRTCHRQFSDDPGFKVSNRTNEGRPIASGFPAFNDEGMLMLAAAARVVAPTEAKSFETASRAFHAAFMRDRATSVQSATRLADQANALGTVFARTQFTRAQTFAVLADLLSGPAARRYTDYQGGAQAVMAVDSLLNALVANGQLDRSRMAALRPQIDRAYALVRDANKWQPDAFRQALAQLNTSVGALK
jgi:hypothetical protein